MFPRMTIKEAKQLVNGKSQKSEIKSPLGNRGDTYENFNCRISGETSRTFMFELDKPFWDKLLSGGEIFPYMVLVGGNIIIVFIQGKSDVYQWASIR